MSYIDSIENYLGTLNDATASDTRLLIEVMQRISNSEAKLWNERTLGFSTYHYKYDSGREGDSFVIGFYPRNGKITIYLMDGTARYTELLSKLGKYSTTGYCVVIKRLSDIDVSILEQLVQQSYNYITTLSQDGPINRILWQTDK
jgi:hypothetical protein